MTPSTLHDPHNHVPDVTPDDEWGDHQAADAGTSSAPGLLPPRKARAGAGEGGEQDLRGGLVLDSSASESPRSTGAPVKLEVEEIDGSVTRLTAPAVSSPARKEKAPVFIERPREAVADRKHRGERGDWGAKPHGSVRWLVGTGCGVAALVVLTLMALPLINRSNAARPAAPPLDLAGTDQPDEEDLMLRSMMVARPEVERVVAAFASAAVADDMLPLVRNRKSVEPLIRGARRPAIVPASWTPPETSDWLVHSEQGLCYGEMIGTYPDFTPFRVFLTLEDGQFLVDWKASTCYSSATFEQLAAGSGDGSEVRGVLETSNFYTVAYPEADFRSYRLDSSDGFTSVWAYTRRGTPADEEIAKLFTGGAILAMDLPAARVTVRLNHGAPDSLPNQWEVDELAFPGWIEPNVEQP